MLPATASPLPLIGALGAVFLGLGGLLAGWRRRRG
jgi:LPXTG-motif cell wall-anchored protein